MKTNICFRKTVKWLGFLGTTIQLVAASVNLTIPGISDPWLAGMSNGATASQGDTAPAQSPVLVMGLSFASDVALVFSPTGAVNNYAPSPTLYPPEGNGMQMQAHLAGAENGIAHAIMPINALLGVFLGPDQPNLTAAPSTLDFTTQASRDFLILRPGLKQVFFIGDGLTSDGRVQRFLPPAGTTRLFLGTMDGSTWFDNAGSFSVTVIETNATVELLLTIQVADIELCWPSISNVWYQVEYQSALTTNIWVPLGGRISGSGSNMCILDSVRGQPRRFYRVSESP